MSQKDLFEDINEDVFKPLIEYDIQKKMESVKEMMTNVIAKTKAEIFRLYVESCNIGKELNVIDDNNEKALRNIIIKAIKKEIQHRLVEQYLEQCQLPVGPRDSLSQVLKQMLKQKKEQLEEEILQQFQQLFLQVTGKNAKEDLEELIKERMACLLSQLEEQESEQLTELQIIINAQEPEQSQRIILTKQELKKQWNGWLMDCRRQYYLDRLKQKYHQYIEKKKLIKSAEFIQKAAHQIKICQQPVQTAYSVSIIVKIALSKEQQAQKPERDRYYLKIACYMAMLSKNTTKPAGACIVDRKKDEIVRTGFKGGPALLSPLRKFEGCTIYLSHCPVIQFARNIPLASISEVVYCTFSARDADKWKQKDLVEAKEFLDLNQIKYMEIDLEKKIMDGIKSHGMLLVDPDKPFTRQQKKFFMEIASLSAIERSDNPDPNLKVGACVVASTGQIISVGFNAHLDSTMIANKQDIKDSKKMPHAEAKAIFGNNAVKGGTLFVTKYPCDDCSEIIIGAEIHKVVYSKDGKHANHKLLIERLRADNVEQLREDKDENGDS